MITMALQNGGFWTDQNSKQMELIIQKSSFSSNFCVDYQWCDIFELWTLSGKLYFLWIEIILARHSARQLGLGPWVSYPTWVCVVVISQQPVTCHWPDHATSITNMKATGHWYVFLIFEPRHEKTGFLHMRKQSRRSVRRKLAFCICENKAADQLRNNCPTD